MGSCSFTAGQDCFHWKVMRFCLAILQIQPSKRTLGRFGWVKASDAITKRIRRSKSKTECNVGEGCKAKLKGENTEEKVKKLEIFSGTKGTRGHWKIQQDFKKQFIDKSSRHFSDFMSSQPQCSPGKVEVRHHLDRNLPRGGEEMLDELLLTQDHPKCNEPVMPPGVPGRQLRWSDALLTLSRPRIK